MSDNSSWFLPLARAIGIQATHSPELIQRLEILSIVTIAGLSMYLLVQSFKIDRFSAVITGLIYAFSPVMFNYTVMGWNNLTLTYASIPLVILLLSSLNKLEQKNRFRLFSVGVLAGVLLTGSAAAASLFLVVVLSWCPAGDKVKKPLRTKIWGTFTFVSGYLFTNAFWIIPRLIYNPYTDAMGLKSIGESEVSRGARQFFSFSSLLTSDYSQFNNSFFVAFPLLLKSLLIGLPVLAVLGIFVKYREEERHLIKRLVLLWMIYAFLSLSSLINRIGPLGLVFGRDPTRLYNFWFFCMALLASFYISTILRNQSGQTFVKQVLVALFMVVQISPFLIGKLESSVMPAQPALTLRPANISGEFSDIYNMIEKNSSEDSSVLVIPGVPNYRLIDEKARFELPFNAVAGVGMHLPLPGTWWATDKISPALKEIAESRVAQLQTGDFNDLWNLMVRENSTLVLVDALGTVPEDLVAIETLLSSGKFLELTSEKPIGISPRRFRLFKSLIPTSADRKSYVPANFLNSSQNPIGSTTVYCLVRPKASSNEPIQFKTPFSFSKNWVVSVKASPINAGCSGGSSYMTELSSQTSSVDGLLNISVVPGRADELFTVKVFFKPARLQEHLIVLTISLLILLYFSAITKSLWLKRESFVRSMSA